MRTLAITPSYATLQNRWAKIGLTSLLLLTALAASLALRPGPDRQSSGILPVNMPSDNADTRNNLLEYPIVFVSRAIPQQGSIYWDGARGLPGVGPFSRFQNCAPGKLQILYPNGNLVTLIDGSNPTAASLNLIDVNAPDVSYDGTKIVFAGLPNGNHSTAPASDLGAWRIFVINVDGTGLTQLTFSDLNLDYSQFNDPVYNSNPFGGYDDTDPCWLPDGRIVFSSTRYPSFAQYSGVRTTNLHVMNANGSNMKRITTERNAADRPVVDPLTGRIVFTRWWRNQRFPYNSLVTVPTANGYRFKDGLSSDRTVQVGGPDFMWRNSWHAATINPDGGDLKMFTGGFRSDPDNFVYGCAFTPEGDIVGNFFPMHNMSEASGFGGIREYHRGPSDYYHVAGLTDFYSTPYVNPENPTSYGIHVSNDGYACEPEVFPSGQMVFSWAADHLQDYGLYIQNADGSGRTLIYDVPGRSELRAKAVRPRPLPPIIPDEYTHVPNPLAPLENPPYDLDGTFTFRALNIYFNAPVDVPIGSAPAVGSAASIRFYLDHQRRSHGSNEEQDWPILVGEVPVNPDGSLINPSVPAEVPLFEQLRSSNASGYKVPFVEMPWSSAAAHVAGMNYGRKNSEVTCVGCHAGHSMIEVPQDSNEVLFSNLAPGATVKVSSGSNSVVNRYLIDRRLLLANSLEHWTSAVGKTKNQWALLKFPVPVTVRQVKIYNIPFGGDANSTLQVKKATITLYSDADGKIPITSQTLNTNLTEQGAAVNFNNVVAQSVRVKINKVSGTYYGLQVSGLGEIEVIASGKIFSNRNSVTPARDLDVIAYPNPTRGQTQLQLYSRQEGTALIQCYNVEGRLLLQQQLEVNEGFNYLPVDLSPLPHGVHMLRVNING
ncbi:MAG: T9SS type A sorting domain-containing protein, partial [Chitinophagales bacterium]|nr:T9SS type A sorting domain-containing protein [Chitinophagales bacterium]